MLTPFTKMIRTKKNLFIMTALLFCAALAAFGNAGEIVSPIIPLSNLSEDHTLLQTLKARINESPIRLYASIIFACAIIHTFFYRVFLKLADSIHSNKRIKRHHGGSEMVKRMLHLLGEVEIIFALWLIPLFWLFTYYFGLDGFAMYMDDLAYNQNKFAEPIFVVLIMCIASSKPIIQIASDFINMLAKIGGGTIKAWWVSILLVGPLLGSFITEPAAITICATLLLEHFFEHKPSRKFKYATLGLLFVAISIGGTLTTFSAPPVLMVARTWNWDMLFMLTHFGWKAILAIILSIGLYLYAFRKEFAILEENRKSEMHMHVLPVRVPTWIVVVHLIYLGLIVLMMHHLLLMFFTFLAFMAFADITKEYQSEIKFKSPILVGIFLASLVIHGSLQGWWIEPLLMSLNEPSLFMGSIALSAFNDNAAITYLASLVENFTPTMQYLIVAAAVSGGGLTVIANAPNLAGLSIIKSEFENGVSPKLLLYGAFFPTLIISLIFYFIR